MVGVYTTTAGTDYSIWAEAGTYTLIATAPDYYTVTLPVTIEAGVTAVHDIALEPNLPRLELNTTAIETSLAAGFTTTLDLMLENTGPAPLIVSFYEISPTLSARPAAPADLTNIHILYDRAHDEEDPTYYSILVSDTVAAGATVDQNFVYPVTQAVLADYDILWVNCCGNIEWSFSELTAVANWLHQGGAILIHGDASNGTRLLPTIYDIMYDNGNYTGGDTTYIEDHPISSNVETVSIPGNYTRLVPGNVHSEVVVLDNNYQQPHIIAHEEGSGKMVVIADIDFHDYYINEAHNRLLANNVMSWLAIPSYEDLPWLSTTPETITIPGHSSATVAVQLDSTALAVGSYEGILALEHNDPNYTFPAQIPVTLNVATAVTALSLTPANQSSGGTPGSTHTYTFTLTNQGNHPDSFTIAVSSDWPATLSASNSGLLDLGEMATFVLTIDIPANAAGDDNATVTATSAFDTAVSTTATATTTLSQRFIYLPFISRSN
jgi:hypothetical protein